MCHCPAQVAKTLAPRPRASEKLRKKQVLLVPALPSPPGCPSLPVRALRGDTAYRRAGEQINCKTCCCPGPALMNPMPLANHQLRCLCHSAPRGQAQQSKCAGPHTGSHSIIIPLSTGLSEGVATGLSQGAESIGGQPDALRQQATLLQKGGGCCTETAISPVAGGGGGTAAKRQQSILSQ